MPQVGRYPYQRNIKLGADDLERLNQLSEENHLTGGQVIRGLIQKAIVKPPEFDFKESESRG